MDRVILFFSLFLLFASCNDDEESPEESIKSGCLDEFPRTVEDPDCAIYIADSMATSDMDLVSIGDYELSESSKASFSDFCFGSASGVSFEDANGNEIEFFATLKTFRERNIKYTIGNTVYCQDIDFARISLKSDQYTFRIYLTNIMRDGFHLTEDITTSNIIAFYVWIKHVDRPGFFIEPQIFLPIEDYQHNSIEPDTSTLKYYDAITLNQKEYFDVLSDENIIDHRMYNRPTVYFHRTQGVVGFIDDQGVLWNRK